MSDPALLEELAELAFHKGQIEKCENAGTGGNFTPAVFLEVVRYVDREHGDDIARHFHECIDHHDGSFDLTRVDHFAALAVAAARGYFTRDNRGEANEASYIV
ncbi:hypothetical protein JDV02_010256 [Purpureocillium takamizusanense]|uniref:Uncharacterized protein n=1 Tax=Purpureocillium takamizusanense TaxID=2060973 RepID=A0A9Q8QRV3_9HYPO|nr:uncharacterized protein JDV02_010256 [Purpureocillium takamizusanense]UNI24518.1 hypothetical protein JDV02_010256 [Purpureocillium takamizusanense]